LQKDAIFGFLPAPGFPYPAHVRYFAYPSRPATPSDDPAAIHTWLVVQRPDITVGSGRLLFQGQTLASSGAVVRRFGTGSFLYRSQ
jgi:hypothetical protein